MTRALQTAAILAGRLTLPVSVQFDLREWLPDRTFSWRTAEEIRAAVSDFDAFDGEWPDGRPRAWEPLSHLRARCTAALRDAISDLTEHEVVIVVAHEMVIWSLTGHRETRPGRWHTTDLPDGTESRWPAR
jgi:broad specificity phosphatase PhoE